MAIITLVVTTAKRIVKIATAGNLGICLALAFRFRLFFLERAEVHTHMV